MQIASEILSDITVHMKYAKYLPEQKRRENWTELCTRNRDMHIKKYPKLKKEIIQIYDNLSLFKSRGSIRFEEGGQIK